MGISSRATDLVQAHILLPLQDYKTKADREA